MRRRRDDRGQAALEYAGVITLLLFVALAAIQLGLVAYTAQQAGTAARAAARVASQDGDAATAGRGAMSDWLADDARITQSGGDEVTVTVRIGVPALLPVFDFGDATRTVTMPRD
ncbi:TadE/TadG family type IV pilus assembly protein [Streptomyces sp. NPDC020681]|uniref:TadE/TadG family type IV pilus assembly protein n=1 Tax=Streptomyces sp. NPDC020681 TaxID=3365083 RepID=UPI0037BBAC0D